MSSKLAGSVVLVTGGTGSFGKAFCKRALAEGARKVIVLSRDELKQYEMAQEFTDERMRYFLGDVRDLARLQRAFAGVDIVVHAAALKQVPAAEYNPLECIKTNITGSSNVIDAAIDCGVHKVVALSTDKAVSPANLYGATKLCMEKLFVASNSYSKNTTSFNVVRYGNVMGSRGSVIPLFQKIKTTTRVYPVTHAEMTRFWISMDKAVSLVVTAIDSPKFGEIYVPKIPSASILDIASAIDPEGTVEFVGIRPGEKLHESLISDTEEAFETPTYFRIGSGSGVVGSAYTSDTNKLRLNVADIRSALSVAALT